MKVIIALSLAVASFITLAAVESKSVPEQITLTQQQGQCFDVAQMLASAIPGKDVFYTFAVECGSKEQAHAFQLAK